jgi:ABC-type multidrug transport system ATPase subunit
LHEIEMIANRMLIIDKGRKIIEGNVQELFDPTRIMVHVQVTNPVQTLDYLNSSHWKDKVHEHHDQTIVLQMDKQQIPLLANDMVQAGAGILAIQPQHSLESYFLSLTTENQHVDAFTN